MKNRKICITEADKNRLKELIEVAGDFGGQARNDLTALANELERADVVDPKDVRPDVVTMNSKVILQDVNTGEEMNYILVFPKDANMAGGAISVLAPIGTAILGYSKGDVIDWQVPAGMRRIRIKEIVYQPEASGHYHL
ncbi:MAG: nucleoside diphosphate kinase regulator [Candidatus Omnitrophica bacterium]|nr:nucleoside diphosphate kinase regulator [Candidatus Omnitrophota bacterium]MDD5736984.1 nucleoside diphosphate kinase regulator [Candidatus Omnitrophota bacterium]